MKVQIRAIGFAMTEALERCVLDRIARVQRRDDAAIRRVEVWLRDINGPRGGADKRCSLRVNYAGRESLSVSRTHEDLYAAIRQATEAALRCRDDRSRRLRDGRRSVS